MQKLREKLKNKKGFTLVEMIVVLAIIGILIALIAPNMARIIKDAQETSDSAKAKTALTAAQAYATRQISAGRSATVTAGVPVPPAATGGNSSAFMIELTDAKMRDAFTTTTTGGTPTTTASTDIFMSQSGDAYLNTNVVSGNDKLYAYITNEGAVMGMVYVNGTRVKAVAGFAPDGVTTLSFDTATLKDKTLSTSDGKIS